MEDDERQVTGDDNSYGSDPEMHDGADGQAAAKPAVFTFAEVMRDSWRCYRAGFVKLLFLVLAVTLPIAIVQVFLINMNFDFDGMYNAMIEILNAGADSAAAAQEAGSLSSRMLLYVGITAFLTSISLITEAGAVILTGVEMGTLHVPDNSPSHRLAVEDEEVSFSLLFELSFRSFPKLWLTMLIVNVVTVLGFMLCIIPGIFMYYVFIFAAYCVELTGLWGRKATFVSSLCTRKFPRASLLFAVLYFAVSEIVLSLTVSSLTSLVALSGIGRIPMAIVQVILMCLRQLALLFVCTSGAVLFSKMLDTVGPIIESSGIRGNAGNR